MAFGIFDAHCDTLTTLGEGDNLYDAPRQFNFKQVEQYEYKSMEKCKNMKITLTSGMFSAVFLAHAHKTDFEMIENTQSKKRKNYA